MVKGSHQWWQADLPIVTAIEGFTGKSQFLAILTNLCHRPQVDSATCSSSLFLFSSSPFIFPPVPLFFSYLFSPPHPFSFLVPLFFFHNFVLSSSQPFLFLCPSPLLTFSLLFPCSSLPFTADISTLLLPFLFLSLSASVHQALLFLCCKALLYIDN